MKQHTLRNCNKKPTNRTRSASRRPARAASQSHNRARVARPHITSLRHFSSPNDFEFDDLPTLKKPQATLASKSSSVPTNHASKQQPHSAKPSSFMKKGSILPSEPLLERKTISISSEGSVSHPTATPGLSFPNADDGEHQSGNENDQDNIIHKADEELMQILARKTPLTPLCHEMRQHVVLRGPLSMAEYMQFCLGHPQFGYYMQRNAIGKKGDFVTSPEISPLFNEMIGIWGLSTWMRMGRPDRLQVIELGPGRGTLMKGFLAAAERFPEFYNAISVHFVENSGVMRKLQRHALGVELDLDFMSQHSANENTDLAQKSSTDAALETAQSIDSDAFFQKLNTLVSQGSSLKGEIQENIKAICQAQGLSDGDLSKIDISQLRPDLVTKLKDLERSILQHTQSSPQNIKKESPNPSDQNELFQNVSIIEQNQEPDDWVWSDKPSAEIQAKMEELREEERKLQGELLLRLPRVNLTAYMTQAEQEAKLAAHDKKIEQMIENDPELKAFIENLDNRLDQINEELSSYRDQMYNHKLHTEHTAAFNKYMSLPMVCGTTKQKFETVGANGSLSFDFTETTGGDNDKSSQLLARDDAESRQENVKVIKKQLHKLKSELPVSWNWTLRDVPSTAPSLILAHEFFDALPVHQFQYTRRGWRELLIDVDETPDGPHHFKYVLSPTPTPASVSFLQPTLLQPNFDGLIEGNPLPLHQHNDDHQSNKYEDDVQISALQTPGRMHSRALASNDASKEILKTVQQTSNHIVQTNNTVKSKQSLLVDATGAPLHPHELHRAAKKDMIEQEILGQSLSQSLSSLANPRVLPGDINQAQQLDPTVEKLAGMVGADGQVLQRDNAPSLSVADETMVDELDARFSRHQTKSKRQLIREQEEAAASGATTSPVQQNSYHPMHGIDPSFEEQYNHDTDPAIANSPHIVEKLRSGTKNKLGDTFETSPASLIWSEHIALHLMKTGGAALLIDYGDNDFGHLTNEELSLIDSNDGVNAYGIDLLRGRAYRDLSLQGIKSHRHVDVLQEPGLVDLSAHVNFAALGAACDKTQKLTSLLLRRPIESSDFQHVKQMLGFATNQDAQEFQPHALRITRAITQSALLQQLGLEERFERLLKRCTTEQEQTALYESVNRLVDPDQMGHLFKAMAIYSDDFRRPPVGWDEHLVRKEHESYSQYQNKKQLQEMAQKKEQENAALAQYYERNKMLREMQRESNDWQTRNQEEYEQRLQHAADQAGRQGVGSTFVGDDNNAANQTLLNAAMTASNSDAQRALDKLQQQKDAEKNKNFYVLDRDKYGSGSQHE